jgi:hypothetical protein
VSELSETVYRKDRGKPPPMRDPSQAVAAAKCVVARDMGKAVMGALTPRFFHPRECTFCEMETGWLRDAVAEFNEWAGLNPPTRIDPAFPDLQPVQPSVESFMLLPREEQALRVERAQGYR